MFCVALCVESREKWVGVRGESGKRSPYPPFSPGRGGNSRGHKRKEEAEGGFNTWANKRTVSEDKNFYFQGWGFGQNRLIWWKSEENHKTFMKSLNEGKHTEKILFWEPTSCPFVELPSTPPSFHPFSAPAGESKKKSSLEKRGGGRGENIDG